MVCAPVLVLLVFMDASFLLDVCGSAIVPEYVNALLYGNSPLSVSNLNQAIIAVSGKVYEHHT